MDNYVDNCWFYTMGIQWIYLIYSICYSTNAERQHFWMKRAMIFSLPGMHWHDFCEGAVHSCGRKKMAIRCIWMLLNIFYLYLLFCILSNWMSVPEYIFYLNIHSNILVNFQWNFLRPVMTLNVFWSEVCLIFC